MPIIREMRLSFADFFFLSCSDLFNGSQQITKNLVDNASMLKRIFSNSVQINEPNTGGQVGKLL